MTRVRLAEIVAVATVAGSLAACGGSSKPAAAPVTVTSTVQAPPASAASASSATTVTPSVSSTTTAASAAAGTSRPAQPSTGSAGSSSSAASDGGDRVTIIGTLNYLAPGKFLVHPDAGGVDQGFYVADTTRILGAAAICGGPGGRVTIGADDYGTTTCTEDQLEAAAKTNAVKVRLTMDHKSGVVEKVEERYHP